MSGQPKCPCEACTAARTTTISAAGIPSIGVATTAHVDQDPRAKQLAELRRELEHRNRIIWLLVHRLGGDVTLTDAEVVDMPLHPPLTLVAMDVRDGTRIIAEPYIGPEREARQHG